MVVKAISELEKVDQEDLFCRCCKNRRHEYELNYCIRCLNNVS